MVVPLTGTSPANVWNLAALGLKLVPIKIPTEKVTIDHIERPSAN
jgi:uncharacterized protein (TIGR03435 family)